MTTLGDTIRARIDYRVLALRDQYVTAWRDKPESYWLGGLIEEVGELGAALNGEHEHPPDAELAQIAAICLNWLEMRAERLGSDGKE